MENHQVTTNEIMEFLQDHMVVKEEFNGLHGQVSGLDARVQNLEVKVNQVKLDLLDAMDEKLADLKGDIIVLMRGEDKKVVALIELLKNKQVLKDEEARTLLSMHPFPQMSI